MEQTIISVLKKKAHGELVADHHIDTSPESAGYDFLAIFCDCFLALTNVTPFY